MDIRQFIIELAVNAFNVQFKKNFKYSDFDVVSIPPNTNSTCGFEVHTTRFDDNFRLRLYTTLGVISHVGKYALKEDKDNYPGSGDELFVADAMLDNEFLYLNNNQIRQSSCSIAQDLSKLLILLQEDSSALLLEDGNYILLEEGI